MNGLQRSADGAEQSPVTDAPLLIVDGNGALGDLVAHPLLAAAGYGHIWSCNHADATKLLERLVPAAIVLQLLPGDESCLDVLDSIPHAGCGRPPVVAISPAVEIDLRVLALERGADDYVMEPFRVEDLLLRLDTARRRRQLRHGRYLRLGGMLVDTETGRFGDGTTWTRLTPKEWRVFEVLIDRRDHLVPRQQLKQAALGNDEMSDNALEAMICRLRAKAGDLGVRIRAQRGAGYRLERDCMTAEA